MKYLRRKVSIAIDYSLQSCQTMAAWPLWCRYAAAALPMAMALAANALAVKGHHLAVVALLATPPFFATGKPLVVVSGVVGLIVIGTAVLCFKVAAPRIAAPCLDFAKALVAGDAMLMHAAGKRFEASYQVLRVHFATSIIAIAAWIASIVAAQRLS